MGTNSSSSYADGSAAKWERKPFAFGASRAAHKGEWISGPKKGKKCVVKTFIERELEMEYEVEKNLECYQVAKYLAAAFNRVYPSEKPIHFVTPIKLYVSSRSLASVFSSNFKKGDTICAEPYLYGDYDKFNSNSGWENKHAGVLCQSFSHFTYVKSNGQGIVCDLQGVRATDAYYLTDPAVHSIRAGRYGLTDLGVDGINAFFYNHKCNQICNELKLPKYTAPKPNLRIAKQSLYTNSLRHI